MINQALSIAVVLRLLATECFATPEKLNKPFKMPNIPNMDQIMKEMKEMKKKLPSYKTHLNVTDTFLNESGRRFDRTWLFKDYMKKFAPINVWSRIESRKRERGLNASLEKNFEEVIDALDETDEFLQFQIDKHVSGRRLKWSPPGREQYDAQKRDPFSARHRFYELMKQVIYMTRNRMIFMQILRKKKRRSALYKMGLLMAKTDNIVKSIFKIAWMSFQSCIYGRLKHAWRIHPYDILHVDERLLNKWFEMELLTDLIVLNDEKCKKMLAEVITLRQKAFNKIFVD